jgi:hypothetical protein
MYEAPEKKTKKGDEKKEIVVKPDDWIERTHFRPLTAEAAKSKVFDLFDVYKKAHGMVSFT